MNNTEANPNIDFDFLLENEYPPEERIRPEIDESWLDKIPGYIISRMHPKYTYLLASGICEGSWVKEFINETSWLYTQHELLNYYSGEEDTAMLRNSGYFTPMAIHDYESYVKNLISNKIGYFQEAANDAYINDLKYFVMTRVVGLDTEPRISLLYKAHKMLSCNNAFSAENRNAFIKRIRGAVNEYIKLNVFNEDSFRESMLGIIKDMQEQLK